MRKVRNANSAKALFVDINGLQEMLSLGAQTSKRIAEQAGAVVSVGERRKVYNVEKVMSYMNSNAEV